MKEIHDNLDPIQITILSFFDWFIIILILILIIIIYFKFIYSKRQNNKVYNKKINNKNLSFLFNKEIKKLENIKDENDWKKFALKATEILKYILEKKYNQSFLFATGEELVEILENKKIKNNTKGELKYFFESLDPIKFSREKILDDSNEIIKMLKEFDKNIK